MKLICAMLAKCAELNQDGSIHVIRGDVDSIQVLADNASALEVAALPVAYIVKLSMPSGDSGRSFAVEILLAKPDGSSVSLVKQDAVVAQSADGRNTKLNFLVENLGIGVPMDGAYSLSFIADGECVAQTDFAVEVLRNNGQKGADQ